MSSPSSRTGADGPRRATRVQLVFLTYTVICSGAYGLEEMVSISGPGLALLILVVLPVVYALPVALACAELSASYPIEGGYYRWVRMAFGDGVGYTAGWLVWLTMFATNASFAVLFGNYLRAFVPELSPAAQFAASASLVWVMVFLNHRGITLVGAVSIVFTILILVPFAIMTVLGLLQWQHSPWTPFAHPDQRFTTSLVGGLVIAVWLYGGFEKLTVIAEEVTSPARTFPIALGIGVPLCAASYLLPTVAALAALGDWRQWGEAHYVTAAARIAGPWLGNALAAGALLSNAGLVMATMLSQSRLPMVLAEDGLFPRIFERRHQRFGTPTASLIATGIGLSLGCLFRFSQLLATYAVVQLLAYGLMFAALLKLRGGVAHDRGGAPLGARGFRIPLTRPGLLVIVLPNLALGLLLVIEGLRPEGVFDRQQALLLAIVFGSGPATYGILRAWTARERRCAR